MEIFFTRSTSLRRVQEFSLKAEGPKADSGGGVLGEGAATPRHQLRGLGSVVSSHSGVRGRTPTVQRFSTIFSTQDGLP